MAQNSVAKRLTLPAGSPEHFPQLARRPDRQGSVGRQYEQVMVAGNQNVRAAGDGFRHYNPVFRIPEPQADRLSDLDAVASAE